MSPDAQRIMTALDGVRAELVGTGGVLDDARGDLRCISAMVDRLPTRAWCRRLTVLGGIYCATCAVVTMSMGLAPFVARAVAQESGRAQTKEIPIVRIDPVTGKSYSSVRYEGPVSVEECESAIPGPTWTTAERKPFLDACLAMTRE